MPLRRAAAATLLLCLAGPALAEVELAPTCLPGAPGLATLSRFTGKCTRALLLGQDRTAECGATVTGVGYVGGRSGFSFELAGGVQVVLVGGEGKADGSILRFKVDTLSTGKGAVLAKSSVRGACILDATDKAAARIACAVPEAGRETRFDFVASGKPEHGKVCPPDGKKPGPPATP
jgi:hypothetical protein